MQKSLVRKGLVLGIIVLFVGASVIPSMGGTIVERQGFISSTLRGNTLYVGGSGPGNYSQIQDAVDDANIGDTIFVFSGVYAADIIVDKCFAVSKFWGFNIFFTMPPISIRKTRMRQTIQYIGKNTHTSTIDNIF